MRYSRIFRWRWGAWQWYPNRVIVRASFAIGVDGLMGPRQGAVDLQRAHC